MGQQTNEILTDIFLICSATCFWLVHVHLQELPADIHPRFMICSSTNTWPKHHKYGDFVTGDIVPWGHHVRGTSCTHVHIHPKSANPGGMLVGFLRHWLGLGLGHFGNQASHTRRCRLVRSHRCHHRLGRCQQSFPFLTTSNKALGTSGISCAFWLNLWIPNMHVQIVLNHMFLHALYINWIGSPASSFALAFSREATCFSISCTAHFRILSGLRLDQGCHEQTRRLDVRSLSSGHTSLHQDRAPASLG